MILALQGHGLWIGLVVLYLLLVCLLVTVTLLVWWVRWDVGTLGRWGRHKLVVGGVFGVGLAVIYWSMVVAGGVTVIPETAAGVAFHTIGSSAGIAGGATLWALTRAE